MLSLSHIDQYPQSLEDKILGMSDDEIRFEIPDKLRDTGLFTEPEIERAVEWLIAYRAQHRLDIIE